MPLILHNALVGVTLEAPYRRIGENSLGFPHHGLCGCFDLYRGYCLLRGETAWIATAWTQGVIGTKARATCIYRRWHSPPREYRNWSRRRLAHCGGAWLYGIGLGSASVAPKFRGNEIDRSVQPGRLLVPRPFVWSANLCKIAAAPNEAQSVGFTPMGFAERDGLVLLSLDASPPGARQPV
jgi:hypothetical protein